MYRLLAAAVVILGCLAEGLAQRVASDAANAPAAEPQRIPLWNGRAPVGKGVVEEADAWITVHRPAKSNGAAIVICPGGGYGVLVTGAEGHGIATWLNRHGITGIVLEYRLPAGRTFVPLWDAQRALRTFAPVRRSGRSPPRESASWASRQADTWLPWLAQRRIISEVSEASAAAPRFVAVGSALRRVASPDGIHWEHDQEVPGQARDDAYLLRGATSGQGLIVAVGQRIFVSRDGREWTEVSVQSNWLGDVAYGNGMFVAVGYHRSIHSRNGTEWSAPLRNLTVSGRRIAFGGGRFVAIGWMTEQGEQVGYSTTTTDALQWTNTKVAEGRIPRSVAFGKGRFVVVGSRGLRESSADGVTWQHRTLGEESEELREVIWTGEQFIALGNRGGYASPDGIQWTQWSRRVPSQVCYGNGIFVGCSAGAFSYSKDGGQWTPAESDSKTQIRKIIFVPGSL